MSTVLEPSSPELTPQPDPFRYGWRYLRRPEADGTMTTVRVPLRREDVLHPQEDDFIVQNETHEEDCHYLKAVLKVHLAEKPGVHVFRDLRIDWGVPDIEPHGPDLAVIANVPEGRPSLMGTLHLTESGAKPMLVVEVTSPSTRDVDLDEKVDEYHQAGIPFYAIVDRWLRGGVEQVRLLAYRWATEGYVRLIPDSEGWLCWNRSVCFWHLKAEIWFAVTRKANAYSIMLRRYAPYVSAKQRFANKPRHRSSRKHKPASRPRRARKRPKNESGSLKPS